MSADKAVPGPALDLDRYITRDPDAAWRVFEDGAVVVSPTESVMHSLNAVGTRVWELADGTLTIGEILDEIVEEFEVDPAQAESDVMEFCQALCDKGMISVE
jgi:DNA-binding ferritin-like protein (Dps family)